MCLYPITFAIFGKTDIAQKKKTKNAEQPLCRPKTSKSASGRSVLQLVKNNLREPARTCENLRDLRGFENLPARTCENLREPARTCEIFRRGQRSILCAVWVPKMAKTEETCAKMLQACLFSGIRSDLDFGGAFDNHKGNL